MKLNLLQVVTLCAGLGQIHSWSNELPAETKNELKSLKADMMTAVYNVSEKFVDDLIHIVEVNRGDVNEYLFDGLIRSFADQKNARMDAEYIRLYQGSKPDYVEMDNIKILQSVLSKRMTPEQYNGLINLFYVFKYPNATSAEIESALNYLYGIDNAATRTSFLNHLDYPDLSAKDCPNRNQFITSEIDMLGLTIDLRPKVIEDITAIREKFPCNIIVLTGLDNFINMIARLNGNKSKIGACMLKENQGIWRGEWAGSPSTKEYREYIIDGFESALLTRVSDETGHGIINLLKANIPGTPIDEIEKALKYLYDDVPETECT